MNIRKAILMSCAVLEYAMNHYDDGMEALYHPGRYLWRSFEDTAPRRPFQKSLADLTAKGLLELRKDHRERYYRITPAGWLKIQKTMPLRRLRQKPWDGLWRVVVYDVPEEKKVARDLLRRRLKELGFRQWQKSTWLTPFDISSELYSCLQANSLVGRISVFEAQNLFGLSDRELAAQVWPLEKLARDYQVLADDWKKTRGPVMGSGPKERQRVREWQRRYWDLVGMDPNLPVELLPEKWPAERVKALMRTLVRNLSALHPAT